MNDPRLDPQIRAILERGAGRPGYETMTPVEARRAAIERLAPLKGEPEPLAHVETRSIEGPLGAIPIRIYTPEAPAPRPGLVYFHGGGWVFCDLETHDVICRAIARRAGAVVVAVDYRLAPEHRFPAAVIDCYTATCWVSAHAADLGIDERRIAVGGDSAGGNLAAAVALKGRDRSGPPIALQVLVYPCTDLSSSDTASRREFAEGYGLTAAAIDWFAKHYLASPQDALNPEASPLLAPDLARLPPALIITAECDPLRDEGEAFARRLEDAGVPVQCTRYTGMIHPFFFWLGGGVKQAHDAVAQLAAAVAACGR